MTLFHAPFFYPYLCIVGYGYAGVSPATAASETLAYLSEAFIEMLFVGFSYSWVLFLIVFIFLIFIGDFQQSADCTACPAAKHGSFFVQDYFLTFKNL